MQNDFDDGTGLPEDELTEGSAMSDIGDSDIGGMEVDLEVGSEAPGGRRSGGARARKSSPARKPAPRPAARRAAPKASKKKGPAKRAKKKAGARKAARKAPKKAAKKGPKKKARAGKKR